MTVRPVAVPPLRGEGRPEVRADGRPDGRRLRSERTRLLIMEAYIELLRERPEVPTAAQIAAKAGISTRLIFERFTDLAALSLATVDHAFATAEAQAAPRGVDGDRATRIRSHVETRAQTCERWLPLWRIVTFNQARLADLRKRLQVMRQVVAARIQLMYGPELGTLSDGERRDLMIVLESLIDFESWGRMREHHGLGVEQACAVWTSAIDRLLPPTPAATK
jgi:AcrR family transcriptional regulator